MLKYIFNEKNWYLERDFLLLLFLFHLKPKRQKKVKKSLRNI